MPDTGRERLYACSRKRGSNHADRNTFWRAISKERSLDQTVATENRHVKHFASSIVPDNKTEAEPENTIKGTLPNNVDYANLRTIPGIGPKTSTQLISPQTSSIPTATTSWRANASLCRLRGGRTQVHPLREDLSRRQHVAKGPGKGERVKSFPEECVRAPRGMALAVQQMQASPLPLLEEVGVRVLGGAGPGSRRRPALRGEARYERQGVQLRARHGEGALRHGSGALPGPDSERPGRRVQGAPLDDLPLGGSGTRQDAERRASPQGGIRGPRKEHLEAKETSHGPERIYKALSSLSEERRAATCETSVAIGRSRDAQCVLTLYLRPFKGTSSVVAAALDALEGALGKRLSQRLFGLIPIDNGCESSDASALEGPVFEGTRTQVYYCDVRQSQQKGECERNHAELRSLLFKGRGLSFDNLSGRDMATPHVPAQLRAQTLSHGDVTAVASASRPGVRRRRPYGCTRHRGDLLRKARPHGGERQPGSEREKKRGEGMRSLSFDISF